MGGPWSLICWLRAWAAAQHRLGLRAGIGRRINRPLVSTRGWRECGALIFRGLTVLPFPFVLSLVEAWAGRGR